MALLVWSVFQIFLPPGPVQNTIFSLLGSILFSAYIVYDTDNLIQRKRNAFPMQLLLPVLPVLPQTTQLFSDLCLTSMPKTCANA